ncbi:helicase-associated domain-containing protein [Streptomyces sp. ST2-7A]|uniref:helicase-associated domain-containing protein n=1 Tax=Streptomyces sp. ST2-7A TaxID=2907214 RepID=UPI001F25338F|nr:helicase-associated domain-containing protein [Streptomyces sp. ST2-7A]MCE7079108.1 helicase-associated domain-containing protein [Streptomyces sp. ST2-7A]
MSTDSGSTPTGGVPSRGARAPRTAPRPSSASRSRGAPAGAGPAPTEGPAGPPRTLGDELRALPDTALAELLRLRPDLLSPLPGDLARLASRAGDRLSVLRAVDRLDTFALRTAEALAIAPQPCSRAELAALLPGAGSRLDDALRALRVRALLWGGDEALRLVRTARELLAPGPQRPGATGLGPTLGEATSGMSPRRMQELLVGAGLPPTGDPVSALASLTDLFGDPDRLDALIAKLPAGGRAVLERLMWGPPYGTVPAHAPAPPAVRGLVETGLLVRISPGTVVLPREVALRLRGGRAHRALLPDPPRVDLRATHPPERVNAMAAGQAYTAVTAIEELAALWERDAPVVLRAGGLGARDLKRTAVALDLSEPEAAFRIEVAHAAGLIATDGGTDERFAPTPAYDEWAELPVAERWGRLVTAWLAGSRVVALIGERDTTPVPPGGARGRRTGADGRLLTALGPGLDRGAAPELRRRVLELLAELPAGGAPDPASLRSRLRWELPRRTTEELHSTVCAATLTEAELLGVTGRGALADHARPLLTPDAGAGVPDTPDPTFPREARDTPGGGVVGDHGVQGDHGGHGDTDPDATGDAGTAFAGEAPVPPETAVDAAVDALAPLLPEPVDHVLLQADLTAVAPGPLRRDLARFMADIADVESTGGATVYRFGTDGVRRALDAGRTREELHTFLAEHSRTPVPQPLAYLIDDTARRHGRLRVGAAGGYLRCEDESLLDQVLADRRSESLRLLRIAPTVAVSPATPDVLLERLRELGLAPAAENAEGTVVTLTDGVRRTPPRAAPRPVPDGPPPAAPSLLRAAVGAIRAGDRGAGTGAGTGETAAPAGAGRPARRSRAGAAREGTGTPPPRTPVAELPGLLRSAAEAGGRLWVGCVGADGTAERRVIAPVRVEGGFVSCFDHTADEVRTYPLHRLTGAEPLPDDT